MTTKVIFLTIVTVNVLAMLFTGLSQFAVNHNLRMQTEEGLETQTNSSIFRFDDPVMAYYLLDKFDVFSVVEDGEVPKANYTRSFVDGFKRNDDYCKEHRAYFVEYPEDLFMEQKFITNYKSTHKVRSHVVNVVGQNLHPHVHAVSYVDVEGENKEDMRVDAHLFFMGNLLYYIRQVGKQFSCLTQAFNHIPGHDNMYRKDRVGQALVNYAKTYESRPQCFNFDEYFPKTWLLKDVEQCRNFFTEFNSAYYQKLKQERNVVYFRKIGADVHEGKGVFPVTTEEEVYIRNLYKNGSLCGKVRDNNLIQYNVHNPLLINNRKFGFRSFLLVASTNPVIGYYHDGYLRLSLDEYDANSKDIKTFVTNIGVNLKEAVKDTDFSHMTPDQIQEHTTWFLEQFHAYLMEHGIVQDPDWLNNYLRPQFKKVMIHLVRMAQSAFVKKSSVYELFGLDFVMDENLGLWFIEANTMPLINGFTKESTVLMNRMLGDSFEIVFSLLRSRAKRIINYINKLTEVDSSLIDTNGQIIDLELRRKQFSMITENKFEPEIQSERRKHIPQDN